MMVRINAQRRERVVTPPVPAGDIPNGLRLSIHSSYLTARVLPDPSVVSGVLCNDL